MIQKSFSSFFLSSPSTNFDRNYFDSRVLQRMLNSPFKQFEKLYTTSSTSSTSTHENDVNVKERETKAVDCDKIN